MLASELLEMSLTEVVNWSLKVVPALRLSAGVAVNVLSLLEAAGAADILIHVVKLSEDSLKFPEQVVSPVFVVMLPVDIASLKITTTVVAGELKVELSSGIIEETVGLVLSTIKEVITRVLLAFPSESVTIIVQSE